MSTSAEQYEIIKKIGEGGMGVVFLAKDKQLQRLVAIKELGNTAKGADPEIIERFQQEALALAKLNHPHITHIYSFVPYHNYFWMVMEFVEGKTLEEWLKIHKRIPYNIAAGIISQILEGLAHAHKRGIIHRDIKPANIMINDDGEVKIMDFGIARMRNVKRITSHGKSIGTLEYMAPEQIKGSEGDERTDIYSTGTIFYELLCGEPLFANLPDYEIMKAKLEKPPQSVSAFHSSVPPALQKIVLKSLERSPDKRFRTVQEYNQEIITLLGPLLNRQNIHSILKDPGQQEAGKQDPVASTPRPLNSFLPISGKRLIGKATPPVWILAVSVIFCLVLLLWGMRGGNSPGASKAVTHTNDNLWTSNDTSLMKEQRITDTIDFHETPNQILDRISKKKMTPAATLSRPEP